MYKYVYKGDVESVKMVNRTHGEYEASKSQGESYLRLDKTSSYSPIRKLGKKNKQTQPDPGGIVADDAAFPHSTQRDGIFNAMVPPSQKNVEEYKLGKDVYALIFAYPSGSGIHLYALLVIGFELTMIVLLYFDLLKKNPKGNLLNVPLIDDTLVCIAKTMALPLAVILHSDFTESLDNIGAEYDPQVKLAFKTATHTCWIFVSFIRFTVGFSLVFLSFIQIVQSSNITDIFINLEAMVFIGEIDNLGFWLAENNYITNDFRDKCEKVMEEIRFPPSRNPRRTHVRRRSMYFTVGSLLVGYLFVLTRQQQNVYLDDAACPLFSVTFGEQTVNLDPKRFEVEGTIRDNTIQLTKDVAEMMFSSFNGVYKIAKDSKGKLKIIEDRPYYIETTISNYTLPEDDGSLARFRYCEGRWYFMIPALANAIGQDTSKEEKCGGWLLRSPQTTANTLEEVGSSGWNIWTGKVEVSDDFTFSCVACSSAVDCNYQGTCNTENGSCSCKRDRSGIDCGYEAPCPVLDYIKFGSSAWDYVRYTSLNLVGLNGNFGVNAASDSLLIVYGRPVYGYDSVVQSGYGRFIYYIGSRWIVQDWNTSEFIDFFTPQSNDQRRLAPNTFWDGLYDGSARFYSSPTTTFTPSGSLTWYFQTYAGSRGDYGPFGSNTLNEGVLVRCGVQDCAGLCGKKGICMDGKCECIDCFSGPFCEFAPWEAYASGLFAKWYFNGSEAVSGAYYNDYWVGKDPLVCWENLVQSGATAGQRPKD